MPRLPMGGTNLLAGEDRPCALALEKRQPAWQPVARTRSVPNGSVA